jgi:hypothetical protein
MSDEEYDYGDDGGYDDEYGDDGDEYEEKEDDYGDDYEYKEDEQEFGFSYRDIGAEGRVGGVIDEDDDLPIGTMTDDIRFRVQLDPDVLFKLELRKILQNERNLFLSSNDKKKIKKSVSKIPMIQYKNPLTYVLGYYIFADMRDDNKINVSLKTKFKNLDTYIKANESITLFEIMKYARYWKLILSK